MSRLQAARAKAQEIRSAQEQALSQLHPHSLYIALWLRNDPPPLDDFHWAFYHHKGPAGGTIYQVKELGEGWITDHGVSGCIFKSLFLCCLVQIGSIAAASEQTLDLTIRSYDNKLNEIPNVTCKVWLFKSLLQLLRHALIHCHDPKLLETECLAFGNKFRLDASGNVQPRPVVVATSCLKYFDNQAVMMVAISSSASSS